MKKPFEKSVVVITGASSGIGRATALRFADLGATVVAVARRMALLDELIEECSHRGAIAWAAGLDVADETGVRDLVTDVIRSHGRIDIWINNAGVGAFGSFESTPMEVHKQVIHTNLFGTMHGAYAVLPIFKRQRQGVLINIASLAAQVTGPYVAAYSASKHAIRAISASLRQELLLEGLPRVRVSTVMPASIDTPFFQHAANFDGRQVKPMPPVYSAEKVVDAIIECARRPVRERYVGGSARVFALPYNLIPAVTEKLFAFAVNRLHFYQRKHVHSSYGNLFRPMPDTMEVSGHWTHMAGIQDREAKVPISASYNRKGTLLASVVAAGAGAVIIPLLRSKMGKQHSIAS
jgi:short-subunit dehydrogenase